MRRGQYECARDSEQTVREQAENAMCKRRADDQQQHADRTGNEHGSAPMASVTDCERNDAQRHDDDQHLRMQMAGNEFRKYRQTGNEKRQRQAVHDAQSGQSHSGTIQPAGPFRRRFRHGQERLCSGRLEALPLGRPQCAGKMIHSAIS